MLQWACASDAVARAEELAALQRAASGNRSAALTLDRPSTAATLRAALVSEVPSFVALVDGKPVGYGLVRRWTETGNIAVQLLDVWAAPGADCTSVEELIFGQLESAVRPEDGILAANCLATQHDRCRLLQRRGFEVMLDMVELEAPSVVPAPHEVPRDVVMRPAEHRDAGAIASLTVRASRDRPFFAGFPTVDEVHGWLASSERDLYLVAEHRASVVGLASAVIQDLCVEIDDVQVDPDRQRRGIASALVTMLFAQIRERSELPVRLHTEGHDPAGALSLYKQLGFRVIARHHRMRKQPVTQGRTP